MVTEFGMSDKLGPLAFGKRDELVFLGREIGEQRNYCDEVAKQIDEEVRRDHRHAPTPARRRCSSRTRTGSSQLAEKLVAEETVDAVEFEKMFADLPPKENMHGGVPRLVSPHPEPPAPPPAPAGSPTPNPSPSPA